MLMIVGPCSIHDLDAGFTYAQRLRELAAELSDRLLVVMRVYFEKPRTTVGWKGLIYDPHLNGSFDIERGLRMAREFLLQVGDLGLLTAIEFVDPITPQYMADLYSWAAIGARTAESQTHRQMSSGLSMPVGFKNGTGGSVQLAVDGVVAAQAQQGFLGVDSDGRASVVVTRGQRQLPHRAARRQPRHQLRCGVDSGRGGEAGEGASLPAAGGRLLARQLRQGSHQAAHRLQRRAGAAGGWQREHRGRDAGEPPVRGATSPWTRRTPTTSAMACP